MGAATTLEGEVSSWSIDSRTIEAGDVFFALRGEAHDGHAFVAEVLRRAEAGEELTITVSGRPVASLGPAKGRR